MEDSYVRTMEGTEPQFHELHLCFFGHSVCHPGHRFGPSVRPVHILHYILEGKGQYHLDGRTYSLGPEQGFLIEPNVMTSYEADQTHPWTYLWVGFDGSCAQKLLGQLGLSHRTPTFSASCGVRLSEIIGQMLEHESAGLEHELYMQSQLYRFFACLSHDLSDQDSRFQLERQNYYVRAATAFIQQHYADDIRVQTIADHIGISRNYLSTLFQNILQESPHAYLANFRLSRAMEQLTITDLPVGAIASMCGYRDPLVFSKAFKLKTGLTPTQYRKTDREKQHMSIKQLKKGR
ncbi:MAG: AraC family transcriptional regulator [Eubacteriales bacterium]|nr:AraC family transcriptional regulator [Eubacteriales bacterium]